MVVFALTLRQRTEVRSALLILASVLALSVAAPTGAYAQQRFFPADQVRAGAVRVRVHDLDPASVLSARLVGFAVRKSVPAADVVAALRRRRGMLSVAVPGRRLGSGVGLAVTVAPQTFSTGPRNGSVGGASHATLAFSSDFSGARFVCTLDRGRASPCSSPRFYDGLRAGTHTFTARAVDSSGVRDRTPARIGWTVRPGVLLASPFWVGDFSSGDLFQWDGLDIDAEQVSTHLQVITAPTPPGFARSLRATVDSSAVRSGEAGQRALLYNYPGNPGRDKSHAYEGAEAWYRTYVYFPADFRPAADSSWNWVVEWHNWPNTACCANLAISVATGDIGVGDPRAEKLALRIMGGGSTARPIDRATASAFDNPAAHVKWILGDPRLQRDHWYQILVHAKWSADARKGLIQWWLDGRRVAAQSTATLFYYQANDQNPRLAQPGSGQAYLQEGYYRPQYRSDGSVDDSSATVLLGGTKIGPTADSTL